MANIPDVTETLMIRVANELAPLMTRVGIQIDAYCSAPKGHAVRLRLGTDERLLALYPYKEDAFTSGCLEVEAAALEMLADAVRNRKPASVKRDLDHAADAVAWAMQGCPSEVFTDTDGRTKGYNSPIQPKEIRQRLLTLEKQVENLKYAQQSLTERIIECEKRYKQIDEYVIDTEEKLWNAKEALSDMSCIDRVLGYEGCPDAEMVKMIRSIIKGGSGRGKK